MTSRVERQQHVEELLRLFGFEGVVCLRHQFLQMFECSLKFFLVDFDFNKQTMQVEKQITVQITRFELRQNLERVVCPLTLDSRIRYHIKQKSKP